MTPTLSFKFVGSTSLRLLTGCSVEPHQPYGVLVASTKGFTNESIKWYCYQWCPSLPLQGVTETRFIILLGPGLLEEKFRKFILLELTPSRGVLGRWSPACMYPSRYMPEPPTCNLYSGVGWRLFTSASSVRNACQPREFLVQKCYCLF